MSCGGSPSGRDYLRDSNGAPTPLGRGTAYSLVCPSDGDCDAARAFIAERDWEKFQDPKSVLLALVGEVGELAELVQWLPAGEARGGRWGSRCTHGSMGSSRTC